MKTQDRAGGDSFRHAVAPELPKGGVRRSRILIIDDEAEVAELLTLILEGEGDREIARVTDPFVAVRRFQDFQPDLVILDLFMPGLSGLEVLRQLKAIIPTETNLPILIVSGDPRIETRAQVLRGGASDFVAKPYDASEVCARVANLLETRFLHLQLVAKRAEVSASIADLTASNALLREEVAARERAERDLREAKESAERANATKSEFFSRASHELRTPMSQVLGFAQLLEADALGHEQQENVQQILSSGHRLLGLIDRILAVAESDLEDLGVSGSKLPGGGQDFWSLK